MSKRARTEIKTVPWDSASHLKTDEDVEAYMEAVRAEGDVALLEHALRLVARVKGDQQDL